MQFLNIFNDIFFLGNKKKLQSFLIGGSIQKVEFFKAIFFLKQCYGAQISALVIILFGIISQLLLKIINSKNWILQPTFLGWKPNIYLKLDNMKGFLGEFRSHKIFPSQLWPCTRQT